MRRAFTFADGAKQSYIVPKISSTLIEVDPIVWTGLGAS
jgi:hypothetical protein